MKMSFAQASQRDARKRTKTQFIRQLFVNGISKASRDFGAVAGRSGIRLEYFRLRSHNDL
jgi:hypothetical protein